MNNPSIRTELKQEEISPLTAPVRPETDNYQKIWTSFGGLDTIVVIYW